jgi:hypothetical protein
MLAVWQEPEDAVVIRLRRVLAEADRFSQTFFISPCRGLGVRHLGDGPDGGLGRQAEFFPQLPLDDLLQIELANLHPECLETDAGGFSASLVARLERTLERLGVGLRRHRLEIRHQLHASNMECFA